MAWVGYYTNTLSKKLVEKSDKDVTFGSFVH